MTVNSTGTSALNERRRLAVKLRLEGRKLKEISNLVDLSSPTIIAAHKQFMKGGWEAVDVKPRGRPSGDRTASADAMAKLRAAAFSRPSSNKPWSNDALGDEAKRLGVEASARTVGKYVEEWNLGSASHYRACKSQERYSDWIATEYKSITDTSRKRDATIYWAGLATCTGPENRVQKYLYAHTTKGKYFWLAGEYKSDADRFIDFFERLSADKPKLTVIWHGHNPALTSQTKDWLEQKSDINFYQHPSTDVKTEILSDVENSAVPSAHVVGHVDGHEAGKTTENQSTNKSKYNFRKTNSMSLTHLQQLEAESIHIMREVVAAAEKPVMLYSIGKDSAVMLHLAQKAFYPAKPPFPLLHVDTGWKFQAMYEFRDKIVKESGVDLIVHKNIVGIDKGVNPFTHGSAIHTDILKTEALKQALDKHGFDIAFGGARRDEEKSRAKERVLSFRTDQHRWDPKNQRPELWNLYNTKTKPGESIRAFPISNWTELDIWQYIHQQNIPMVPLYFAAERPVVLRDGTWIMVDDDRMPMNQGEAPIMKRVRFRTLGCYPLTGAIESDATTVSEVIQEMLISKNSERQGRLIDHDNSASMEKKKQEGYF